MSSKPLVLVLDFVDECKIESKVLEQYASVDTLLLGPHDAFPEIVSQAIAVIIWHEVVLTEDKIAQLTNCKMIIRCGMGYDAVDLKAAGLISLSLSVCVHVCVCVLSESVSLHVYTLLFVACVQAIEEYMCAMCLIMVPRKLLTRRCVSY